MYKDTTWYHAIISLSTWQEVDCHIEYNEMEFPTAFLAFPNDFEYSMVCSFCADFDLDVLYQCLILIQSLC